MNLFLFSVWGTNKNYLAGIEENIKLQKKLFPEWNCRFLVSTEIEDTYLNIIEDNSCELIIKENLNYINRFEGLFFGKYDYIVSRDIDARLLYRDVHFINQWIQNDKSFHIVRDHPCHMKYILAGMFGMKYSFMEKFKTQYDLYAQNYCNGYGPDEDFLCNHIWPLIINEHIAHDEYFRPIGNEFNYGIEYENDCMFIGNKFRYDNKPCLSIKWPFDVNKWDGI